MDTSRGIARRAAPLAGVVLVTALGCAGAQARPSRWRPSVETLPDGTQVICQLERPTGSHIAEPVCRRVDAVTRQREQTQVELLRPAPTHSEDSGER